MTEKPGVLVLNGCLPPPYGGIARYLSRMLPLLVHRGHPVWAMMPRAYSEHTYTQYKAQGIGVVIPPRLTRTQILSTASRYVGLLWEGTVRYRLPFREAFFTLITWLPEAEALLAHHQQQIGIIHAFDAPWSQGWIARYLAQKYQKAFVMTTYGEVAPHADPLTLIDEQSYRYRPFCAEIVHSADAVTSMTAYCAAKLAFLGIEPGRVRPLHHLVGMEEFIQSPRAAVPLAEKYPVLRNKRLILYAGQLLARKGADLLVQVAAGILAHHADCLFAFVGPDLGFLEPLQALARQQGVWQHCLFTGAVSDEELRHFYAQAEIFTFTTVAPIECLGLTFVQAMYARCPVVASNISGVPEVIVNNENGLLFEPGNAEQIKTAILRLLDDPALARRLAARAYGDVTARFSEATALDQLEQLYADVSQHHPSTRMA